MTTSPGTTIDHDLPCAHCDYNLRAQAADGTCPECGKPVADALANPLRVAEPRRVALIRCGLWWGVLAFVGLVVDQLFATANFFPVNLAGLSVDAGWILTAAGGVLLLWRIKRRPVRDAVVVLYVLGVLMYGRMISYTLITTTFVGWLFRNVSAVYVVLAVVLLARPLSREHRKWFSWLVAFAVPAMLLEQAIKFAQVLGVWPGLPYGLILLMFDALNHVVALLLVLHIVELATVCRMSHLLRFGRWLSYAMAMAVGAWLVMVYGIGGVYWTTGATVSGTFSVVLRAALLADYLVLAIALFAGAVFAGMLARRMRV